MVAAYLDNDEITGRGRYEAWRNLVARLDTVDQIVVADAAALPGRSVADVLKTLASLRDCGVGLHLLDLDTGTTTCEVLDIIAAFRRAKLSHAIRAGQARALQAGKRIGRPPVPTRVHNAIQDALISGGGIRPTARKFKVSPAFVVNVRRTMLDAPCTSY
jgi:DNA invertase Pin-like site-specific DNA recombinase